MSTSARTDPVQPALRTVRTGASVVPPMCKPTNPTNLPDLPNLPNLIKHMTDKADTSR